MIVFTPENQDQKLAMALLAKQILGFKVPDGQYFGVMTDDEVVAVIIFHSFVRSSRDNSPLSMEVTLATTSPIWASRKTLRELFSYPFKDAKVKVFWGMCSKKNRKMRSLFDRLGFKFEGVARGRYPDGTDGVSYSMTKDECKWIK